MDEHPNPRNRADPELILSNPLPESSTAASATRSVTTNTASPFEPFRSASDPRNRARYSKKNTVLLCDWWLLLAPEVHEGRRLSVGGVVAERYRGSCRHEGDRSGSKFLLSPWQKAERVFESAPITKRYDSFTLGTADGITVRIQGVINKACSHQNGIPLEVCNSFLIGFPFNWDNYAGACFEGKFNSASVPKSAATPNELSEGFADAEGRLFPVHLDDFSLSRIHDGSVDGSVTSKFRDFLKRFCYTTKPLASDVHNCTLPLVESCLPHEPPSKHERATVLAQVTEGLEHVARFDKLSCSSSRDHQNILVEGLDPTPPRKKIAEKEKYEKERIRQRHVNGSNHVGEGYVVGPPEAAGCYRDSLQGDEVDGGNFMTAHIENNVSLDSSLYVASQVNTLPIKVADVQKISLESIPEIDNCIRLATSIRVSMGTVDLIPNCTGEANSESFECSADLGIESGLVRNVSDMKDTNSLIPLEISRKPVIAISPKASDSKEKVCRRSSRIASILHPEILATDGNSEFRVPKDCTASISSVHMSGTSDVGLYESLTEPLGKRDRSMKLKVFKKDQQCAECMNSRSCMHRTPSEPHESAGNEKCQTKLDMPGKSICGATDDMFSIENNTMPIKRQSTTQSVIRKLYYTTRSGRLVGSSTNESQILDERVNERMENVEDIPATDATSISRTTKSKNPVGVDQTISSLKAETNGDRVVRVDHSFVKTVHDGKYKRRNLSACYLATARAVYFTHESSATKLQIDPAPTSDTEGGGLTDEQISVNTGHESEFLKSTTANTTQSDTITGIHSSKEQILDLSINKIQNNQSKRGREKKQRPLSVSNFTHQSSATKLQIDPAPTSDTKGGGLTDEQISVNTGHESEFLKSTNANTTESDTITGIHSSKEKILDLSINKIQNNQSKRGRKKKQSPPSVYQAYKKGRSLHSSGTTIWKPSYDNQYPLTRDTAKKLCIASPESLNLKRSRSGRLLVPPIAQWCQKIIYAANGEITAVTGEGLENFPCIESQSEPPRKRKRLV